MAAMNSFSASSQGAVAYTDARDDDKEVTQSGAGEGGLVLVLITEDGYYRGILNPVVVKHSSPLHAVVATMAHVWKELSSVSHRWTNHVDIIG